MKTLILTGITASLLALSSAANASPFNYVDYTIGTISYDYSGVEDGDYSSLSASFETSIVPIIDLQSWDFDGGDSLWLGAGAYAEIGAYSHLYGIVHYVSTDDDDEVSLTAGVRSTIADRLELSAELQTLLTDSDANNSYTLSLGYYFTENVSVAGEYIISDNYSILGVGARYSW
ncbi:hypothetical protein OAH87_00455 [Marinomonas sp.]|nr:hypothetical protein [Marinomonas sp.]MDB4836924.1 hypothetical protein [Marinomonas sp.]